MKIVFQTRQKGKLTFFSREPGKCVKKKAFLEDFIIVEIASTPSRLAIPRQATNDNCEELATLKGTRFSKYFLVSSGAE
jgi:hypothetical protein